MARILIVDDEEIDRFFQSSVLKDAGHELLFAPDGEAALGVWRDQDIDLVITDLAMPHLNGLRLIKSLKELDPDARIIAVSGVAADQLDLAEDFGAMRTLFKPVGPEVLLTAVQEILARPLPGTWDPWGSGI